jgi:TetR/AcrR family transcriptional regulator
VLLDPTKRKTPDMAQGSRRKPTAALADPVGKSAPKRAVKAEPAAPSPSKARWNNRLPSQNEIYNTKRTEIVRAAELLFSRRGYHGVTLAQVAVELGVTKQALYYYFPDKESLLYACGLEAHQRVLDVLEEEDPAATNGRERLANLLLRYILRGVIGHLQSVMFLDGSEMRPEHLAEIMVLRDQSDQEIRRIIEGGISDGSLKQGDPKLMSFAAFGAANWIARWYDPDGPLNIEEIATAIVQFAVDGISAQPQRSPAARQKPRSTAAVAPSKPKPGAAPAVRKTRAI